MARVIDSLDSLLTWAERLSRVPGGALMLSVALGLLTAALAIWSRLYWIEVAVLALVAVAAMMVILALLPSFRDYLGPPIIVEITGIGFDKKSYDEDLKEIERMRFENEKPIYILNRSKKYHVALTVPTFNVIPKSGDVLPFSAPRGVTFSEDVKLSLAPEEETRGTFSVSIGDMIYLQVPNEKTLLIVDRLSGRKATVPVPGRFPARR
jgi:hypothetical protein